MKPLPEDTDLHTYEYPVFEAPEADPASPLATLPQVEGFTLFDPEHPITPSVDLVPVVQKAVFQDFKKVIPQIQ